MICLDICCVVYYLLLLYLVVFRTELIQDLLEGSQLVGVVDVDEVGFDVVRNGIVVCWFPEGGLAT